MTACISFVDGLTAGEPEIPPGSPPEVPPGQAPEVPDQPVPESEPPSPPELPPDTSPEVPPEPPPPETRNGGILAGSAPDTSACVECRQAVATVCA